MFFNVNLKNILDIDPEAQSRQGTRSQSSSVARNSGNTDLLEGLVLQRVADIEQGIEQKKIEEQRGALQAKELAKLIREYETSSEVRALMRYLSITQQSCRIWSPDYQRRMENVRLPDEHMILGYYRSALTLTDKGFVLEREHRFLDRCFDHYNYSAKTHFLDRHGDPVENPGGLTRFGAWLGFVKKGRSLPIEPLTLFIRQGLTMDEIMSGVERECYRIIGGQTQTPAPAVAPVIPAPSSLQDRWNEMRDLTKSTVLTHDSGVSSHVTQQRTCEDSSEALTLSSQAEKTTSSHPLRRTSFLFVNGDT